MNIAILSTTKLPKFLGDNHPNEQSLFAEDDVLANALADRGATARRVPWRQRGVEWGQYDLVLVRSTWDYIDDLPAFLDVLGEIDCAGCLLVNPLETIKWNSDKRYLAALSGAGVPIVPTTVLEPGQDPHAVLENLDHSQTGYVIKPVVGVGAFGAKRLADTNAVAEELISGKNSVPYIIQPFLTSVTTEGEWSFVFGGGRFLYAALKTPKAGDFRVQVIYGANTVEKIPTSADLAIAYECFHALPVPAHFARIDMTRMPSGRLALMEAELIEPQLFFFDVPDAADLAAEAALSLIAA